MHQCFEFCFPSWRRENDVQSKPRLPAWERPLTAGRSQILASEMRIQLSVASAELDNMGDIKQQILRMSALHLRLASYNDLSRNSGLTQPL